MGIPDVVGTVPLTMAQRCRLLIGCIPLILGVLAFVLSATFLSRTFLSRQPLFLPLMGIIVVGFGFQARSRLRDLASGKAVVCEDMLERYLSDESHDYHGHFKRIGTVRFAGGTHMKVSRGW